MRGWTFDRWFESGSRVSTNASWRFSVDRNRNLEARFSPTQGQEPGNQPPAPQPPTPTPTPPTSTRLPVTITNGQIYEFRNISTQTQRLTFGGDPDALVDFVVYLANGSRRVCGRNGLNGHNAINVRGHTDIVAGGKIVIELWQGSHFTVAGDSSRFPVIGLRTPVLYSQTVDAGGTVVFNSGSNHPVRLQRDLTGPLGLRPQAHNWGQATHHHNNGTTSEHWIGRIFVTITISADVHKIVITAHEVRTNGIILSGDYVALSGQSYRLTVCGQRSFPPAG